MGERSFIERAKGYLMDRNALDGYRQRMNFWNWDALAWSALGTLATAAIALIAAAFAWRQVGEARKLREAQAQPFVVVNVEPSVQGTEFLMFVVENIGQTLARNVHFEFSPKLESKVWSREPVSDLNQSEMFKNGFASMPPGMRIERFFDNAFERTPGDELPWAFDVTVNFCDYRGKRQTPLEYTIDLLPLTSGTYMSTYGVHHVAESLRDIHSILKSKLK